MYWIGLLAIIIGAIGLAIIFPPVILVYIIWIGYELTQ